MKRINPKRGKGVRQMRILRLTRHPASEKQLDELCRIFGEDADITMISETLPGNPREAVARFDEIAAEADVVEAVLPVNLLEAVLKFSRFSKRGGQVIRAATERQLGEDGQATFEFQHYELVRKVEVVTEVL